MADFREGIEAWAEQVGEYRLADIHARYDMYVAGREGLKRQANRQRVLKTEGNEDLER